MNAGAVTRLSNRLTMIDLAFQGVSRAIVVYVLETDGGLVLTDIGPASVHRELVGGMERAGFDMADVRRIALTHIHLDHAGGTGTLLRRYPHIRTSVHAEAVRVLTNPAPLWKSATRSFGDRMHRLWDEVLPVDQAAIDPIREGEMVPGTRLRAIATAGHSGTHLAYLEEESGVMFTGDAAHARLHGSSVIVPTVVPPELDIDAWRGSVVRMKDVGPTALALPHGGYFTDAADHLSRIMPTIEQRVALAERFLETSDEQAALAEALYSDVVVAYARAGELPDSVEAMELAMPAYLGAQGLARWLKLQGRFS